MRKNQWIHLLFFLVELIKKAETVKYNCVQPTNFTDHKVLEPDNSVKHLKDHILLLQGTQLELLHHILDTALVLIIVSRV